MATTRTVLRQRVSESMNDYWSSTATGNGTSTTLVDTVLKQLVENDDDLRQYYLYFTSGTAGNIGKTRRINLTGGFTWSSGTCTWASALGSATASADGYELHRINPDLKNNGINRAAEYLSRLLFLPVVDETLIVDGLGSNMDGDTYAAAAFTGWFTTGSPTMTQETSIVMHSANSMKMVSSGAAIGYQYQTLTVNQNAVAGKTLWFKAWVYASAGTTRIAVSFDGGSTFTYSSYHSGNSDWERLEVSAAVPTTATSIRIYLAAGTASVAATSYFDACRAWIAPLYRYTVPSALTDGVPLRVSQQMDEDDDSPTALYFPIGRYNPPVSGRRLRIEGRGTLTRPSSETATMEVSNEFVNVIVQGALMWINRALASDPGGSMRDLNSQDSLTWKAELKELVQSLGIKSPPLPVEYESPERDGWMTGWDGETSYLRLTQPRGGWWW